MRMKKRAEIINDLVPDSQVNMQKVSITMNQPPDGFWEWAPGSARKIGDWGEAVDIMKGQPYDMEESVMPEGIEQWLGSLPGYSASDIYDEPNPSPAGSNFSKTPDEQWFILNMQGTDYLVDAEGYDYARYVWRLS